MSDRTRWAVIGQAGVDSGQLLLIDPCYIKSGWREDYDDAGGEYRRVCDVTLAKDAGDVLDGVAFSSGWGDGAYPVAVLRTGGEPGRRRVFAAVVVFDQVEFERGLDHDGLDRLLKVTRDNAT